MTAGSERMDIIKWFGGQISSIADRDPGRARALMLTGFRAESLRLLLPQKSDKMGPARRYGERQVIKIMIKALAQPQKAAFVSIFAPAELLNCAGLSPFSVEAMSGYLMGSYCENYFQGRAGDSGFPETLCSFHRSCLGAAESGLLPAPRCIVYTSLACDANLITFPYLARKYAIPSFFIDVPYEKSEDAVAEVAAQLRHLKDFLEEVNGRRIDEAALRSAVARGQNSADDYLAYLEALRCRRLPGSAASEMYTAMMSKLLIGSRISERYFALLRKDVFRRPPSAAKRLLFVHVIPYMQPVVKRLLGQEGKAFITACDMGYDSMLQPIDPVHPYETMARRLVYSVYNGPPQERIEKALLMAKKCGADGIVIFAHWGCKETLGAVQIMKDAFSEAGMPALILDGDAGSPANSGDGQMNTRLEAFLEMLEGGK